MNSQYKDINILILGNEANLKVFGFLKHFHLFIFCLDKYENQDLSRYDLIITNSKNLKNIQNDALIFNVVENTEQFSCRRNTANIIFENDKINNLTNKFIGNNEWIFYYSSIDKTNVNFINNLFTICYTYKKIKSHIINFIKI